MSVAYATHADAKRMARGCVLLRISTFRLSGARAPQRFFHTLFLSLVALHRSDRLFLAWHAQQHPSSICGGPRLLQVIVQVFAFKLIVAFVRVHSFVAFMRRTERSLRSNRRIFAANRELKAPQGNFGFFETISAC